MAEIVLLLALMSQVLQCFLELLNLLIMAVHSMNYILPQFNELLGLLETSIDSLDIVVYIGYQYLHLMLLLGFKLVLFGYYLHNYAIHLRYLLRCHFLL